MQISSSLNLISLQISLIVWNLVCCSKQLKFRESFHFVQFVDSEEKVIAFDNFLNDALRIFFF